MMPVYIEIEDDYEHTENIEYVLENVLMCNDGTQEYRCLEDDFNSQIVLSCKCMTGNATCNNLECYHSGGLKYSQLKGELVVTSAKDKEVQSIVECNDLCECEINRCFNRRVQFGPRKKLDIFNSPLYKSKGLRTTANIPIGAFICEYAGELLTLSEARKRSQFVDQHFLMNFILCLYEHTEKQSSRLEQIPPVLTIVDPSNRGNIGRYLNHSCKPNCEIIPVRTNCPIPKIGIFAKRDINANEELCFHYGGTDLSCGMPNGKPCLCGASCCIGYIPNIRY